MGVTVAEANAINVLVRASIGARLVVMSADAIDAARLLADSAHKRLAAGVTSADVVEWSRPIAGEL